MRPKARETCSHTDQVGTLARAARRNGGADRMWMHALPPRGTCDPSPRSAGVGAAGLALLGCTGDYDDDAATAQANEQAPRVVIRQDE